MLHATQDSQGLTRSVLVYRETLRLEEVKVLVMITHLVDWRTALEMKYCNFRVCMFTELAMPF